MGAGASVYGAKEQADAQREANKANVDLAREQMSFSGAQAQREMDFQERMSNTSYQRSVADMKAAGINPMMAIGNGGASTPSGAMGAGSAPSVEAVPSVVSNSLSSAVDVLRSYADVRKALADADSSRADANLKWKYLPRKTEAESGKTEADAVESKFRGRLYDVLNQLFDRMKGAYNNAAKGQKLLPFLRKGDNGVDVEMTPFIP